MTSAPVPFLPNERITDAKGLMLVPFATKLNGLQRRVGLITDAIEVDARDAAALRTYTVGGTAVSGQRVLMTIDSIGTVGHADPSVVGYASRIVGISVGAAYAAATVDVRWLGELEDPGFAFNLTKRIFCGAGGQLTQTPPTSGFARCVGQPITPTKMRVDFNAPIFLA
jgi:hypothetical protein